MTLFIVGLVLDVGLFGYFLKQIIDFVKGKEEKISAEFNKLLVGLIVGQGLITILSSYGVVYINGWDLKFFEHLFLIIGSILLGIGVDSFFMAFILYYWKLSLDPKLKEFLKKVFIGAFFVALVGLWLFSEGIAKQDIYPLINGIDFAKGFINPNQASNGLVIKFYGIIIVCGALICYFITDHETYKKFGEHGLIDTLFIFAFICGLIGARLWYCLILEKDYFLANPAKIITGISEGGLAIQGGALLGMAGGIIFVLIFRKYIDVRFLMDVAIPSILLAQALGRWGNFFNQEVYGAIAPDWLVKFLPTIVKNNMEIYSSIDHTVAYRVPLFLIESLINIGGYFFIRYFLGKICKFHIGLGYQAASYLVWYGIVRAVLEPLRSGFTLQVGTSAAYGYMQSWIVAFAMIGGGLLWLLGMFILHKVREAKGLEDAFGEKIKAK